MQTISKAQIIFLAIAAGVCVANIYYNQPILSAIAADLRLTEHQVGYLPVLTQVGYGAGLLLLTPLGDKVERKRLIIVLQSLLILVLIGMSLVNSLAGLYTLSLLTGVLAVATQVIMPMAASLAGKNKGKVVGMVFTGLLTGILCARIFSGYIASWLSWRYVYGFSACLLACTTMLVARTLPAVPPQYTGNYASLLSSTIGQLKRFSLLRTTALLGAFVFGTFCSFWTTLTFQLSGAPFHYKSDIIGLFGVLAIGGALVAPVFGRMADKGNPVKSRLLTVGFIILSILVVWLWPSSTLAFIVTTLLIDIGVQATQVSNIARIYTLDETAHSRINTMYMTLVFIGGAFGTWAGVTCWAWGGWDGVCRQMMLWAVIALAISIAGYRRSKKVPV